jgi:RNA polymerase subunit RPABC4/transcription elongation factor Spt4
MKKKECPSCAMEIDAKEKICPICSYEFAEHSSAVKWVALLLALLFLLYFLL